MKKVSLIAFYGKKDGSLAGLLEDAGERMARCLGPAFDPYPPEQVHATLIGMEGVARGNRIHNANFAASYGVDRTMQIADALQFIERTSLLPVEIVIGGYHRNSDYGFTSFGRHPWARSFCIHGDKVILIGWPASSAPDRQPLARLRRAFEDYGILHKWHDTPEAVDNDCYLVIGNLRTTACEPAAISETLQAMRDYLSGRTPLSLSISRDNLSFIRYTDVTLPLATTQRLGVATAARHPGRLLQFFDIHETQTRDDAP